MKNDNTQNKKNSLGKNILLAVLTITGIAIVCGKIIEAVKNAKYTKANIENKVKQYFAFLSAIMCRYKDEPVEGIVCTGCLSAVNIDITDCDLKDNAFISLKTRFSAVQIIVPENVNVIVDGLYNKSCIINQTDSEDTVTEKTLYIAVKADFSAIKITRAK